MFRLKGSEFGVWGIRANHVRHDVGYLLWSDKERVLGKGLGLDIRQRRRGVVSQPLV